MPANVLSPCPKARFIALFAFAFVAACGGGSAGDSGNTSIAAAPGPAGGGPAAAPTPVGSGSSIPSLSSIAGKTVVGHITATSGQVIENVHVTTSDGPCILIPSNVSDVTIRNSEIGPCGTSGDTNALGISIDRGASSITIERNVIHNVASGVYADSALHPIVVDRNFVTDIRGPLPRGQMVQFNGVHGGTSRSKITCNVSDTLGAAYSNVEDHVNMFDSPGLTNDRTEIAYNRLRGGHPTSDSGSGINTGDGQNGGGNAWVHHNTVVEVKNVGIGIAGGSNTTLESNRVYTGRQVPGNVGIAVINFSAAACMDHEIKGNRVNTLNTLAGAGVQNAYYADNSCSNISLNGNAFGDNTLTPAIFDEVYAECN